MKKISCFLVTFLLLLQVFYFLPIFQVVNAEFIESFSTATNISSVLNVDLNGSLGQATLPYYENSLSDDDTLLLSHLGEASDITSPAIGVGGIASSTLVYVEGYIGNAVQLPTSSNPLLYFPKNGNLNKNKGSISFWAKSDNWSNNPKLFSEIGSTYNLSAYFNTATQIVFYVTNTAGMSYVHLTVGTLATSTWHSFVFSWDCQGGTISATVDSTITNTYNITGGSSCLYSTSTGDILFGHFMHTSVNYLYNPVNYNTNNSITFDEIRITDKPYSPNFNYDYASGRSSGILTSKSFDTGVENPIWGNIEWTGYNIATGTPIFIQTDVSSDGVTWDGWLRKGMVSFTYDDYCQSVWTNAKPIFDIYGFKPTLYLITNAISDVHPNPNPNYMSVTDILAAQADGWEIGSHGVQHLYLDSLNEAEIRTEFGNSAEFLRSRGVNVKGMATPFGAHPGKANEHILDDYYSYVRGGGGYNTVGNANSSYLNYGPFNILWRYAQSLSDYANATSAIDNAATNKQWVIFVDHNVDADDALLTPLAAYVASKDVDVVTVAEGLKNLSYQTSSGSQITSANKRYIRYRAILFTTASTTAPVLTSVTIREPSYIYKETTTTVNASGIHTHSVWPQTTDTQLDFTLTPSTSSVDVVVDTWSTTSANNYYKKWIESATTSDITAVHNIGGFEANKYYRIKIDSIVLATVQASATGSINFTYSGGYSDHVFEVEQANPDAPTIGIPTGLSPASIRWNFTDNASNETGFVLINTSEVVISTSSEANLSYIDETGLTANTQYQRAIKAYNDAGYSASSAVASRYTLAPIPFNLTATSNSAFTVCTDSFTNSSDGSSGYLFWQKDNSGENSGWITENCWKDQGIVAGHTYSYCVKYRNGDGIETATTTSNNIYISSTGYVDYSDNYQTKGFLNTNFLEATTTIFQNSTSTSSTQTTSTLQLLGQKIPNLSLLTGQARQVAIQQIQQIIVAIQKQLIILIGQLIQALQAEIANLTR